MSHADARLSKEVRARLRRKEPIREKSESEDESQTCHEPERDSARSDVADDHVKEGDIGPTVRGASSIERLFAPHSIAPPAPDAGLLCRSDPIGYGYMDEAMARDLFGL